MKKYIRSRIAVNKKGPKYKRERQKLSRVDSFPLFPLIKYISLFDMYIGYGWVELKAIKVKKCQLSMIFWNY